MPSRPPSPRPKIVVLTPHFPQPHADNAGMHYVQLLREAIEPWADLIYIAPDFPSNREARGAALPDDIHIARTSGEDVLRRVHAFIARVDPGRPYLPFVAALLSRETRAILRSADVVDMQWEEFARLARLVRRLAPDAELIGTYHDVLSQRYERSARGSSTRKARLRWTVAAAFARRHERRSASALDTAIFFSDKDRHLVRVPSGQGVVVGPPVAGDGTRPATPLDLTDPVVTFVAYLARPENIDAATWLLVDIWPIILAQRPDATLRIVGAGATGELAELARATPGARLVGFVDDLAEEYHQSRVCIVPLRFGAGVKFKVIDAMSYGVPVVSTTVGAEGIGDSSWFAGISDDAQRLAQALLQCLDVPMHDLADATRVAAVEAFGYPRFADRVQALYQPRKAR